jgi:hypothetical protein
MTFDLETIVGAFKLTGTHWDPEDSISATPVPVYEPDDIPNQWVINRVSYHDGWEGACLSVYIMQYDPPVGFTVRPLLTESVF